jgi:hypothetical protein
MTQPSQIPYGSCLATMPDANGNLDLTPDMQMATGRVVLAQSLIRRQTTPRGSVITSPNDCIDIRQLLSKEMTQTSLQALASLIKTELIKDQRVTSVSVQISVDALGNATITENIGTAQGPFSLTLGISASGAITQITQGQ